MSVSSAGTGGAEGLGRGAEGTTASGRRRGSEKTGRRGWGRAESDTARVVRNCWAGMVWKAVWRGVTVSWGLGLSSTAAGRVWSRSRAARTAWYTAPNTERSLPNFTSVLAGWTFTSTALRFSSRWRTQAGNLPTIFWFLYASSRAAIISRDFTCRPLTKKNCQFRLARQQAGWDT